MNSEIDPNIIVSSLFLSHASSPNCFDDGKLFSMLSTNSLRCCWKWEIKKDLVLSYIISESHTTPRALNRLHNMFIIWHLTDQISYLDNFLYYICRIWFGVLAHRPNWYCKFQMKWKSWMSVYIKCTFKFGTTWCGRIPPFLSNLYIVNNIKIGA